MYGTFYCRNCEKPLWEHLVGDRHSRSICPVDAYAAASGEPPTNPPEGAQATEHPDSSAREAARRAKNLAAAPDYDEEAIRGALWDVVDAVLRDACDRCGKPGWVRCPACVDALASSEAPAVGLREALREIATTHFILGSLVGIECEDNADHAYRCIGCVAQAALDGTYVPDGRLGKRASVPAVLPKEGER